MVITLLSIYCVVLLVSIVVLTAAYSKIEAGWKFYNPRNAAAVLSVQAGAALCWLLLPAINAFTIFAAGWYGYAFISTFIATMQERHFVSKIKTGVTITAIIIILIGTVALYIV